MSRTFDDAAGSWVREARESAGMTQSKLACLTGAWQGKITEIERGNRRVTLEFAYKIREVTGAALPKIEVDVQTCPSCNLHPPAGFTCNRCGMKGTTP